MTEATTTRRNRRNEEHTENVSVPEEASMPENTDIVDETPESTVLESTVPVNRIPDIFNGDAIFGDMLNQFLNAVDEIATYNKSILAERDSEWNGPKLINKARELAHPATGESNEEVKKYFDAYEEALTSFNLARRAAIDNTAKFLGVTIDNTVERNPEIEAPLKAKRVHAMSIAKNLEMMAGLISDKERTTAITEFLKANDLPVVGRDQTTSFGSDEKPTPKYRVTVKITKGDTVLLEADGFTKAATALSKPEFGYERGEQLKSSDLREVWEKAGNSAEKTVTNPVEFTHNELHYVITKK